ncbi:MAG: alkene reductase, partial [Proteobacteria bacterium]
MSQSKLFESYKLGRLNLKNRVVMAPMTRNRSPNNIPDLDVATYYAQRAEAGLIITEGTSPAAEGLGYARIPGLFSKEQVVGWRNVTDKVHGNGSHIFVQLMHTGRASHPDNLKPGLKILAPSAIALG